MRQRAGGAGGAEQQWRVDPGRERPPEPLVQVTHRLRRVGRRDRREPLDPAAVRAFFLHLVVESLPMPRGRVARVPVEVAVQLLHVPGLERDVRPVGVYQPEHTPVSGDLLLGAVLRGGPLGDEGFDARPRRANILDGVRGLRALYQREQAQRLKTRGALITRDLLATMSLRDAGQRRHGPRLQRPEVTGKIAKAAHPRNVLLTADEYAVRPKR
jgi:hypothetical protein